jgi:sulfoxide reductase heme-binding subunit YedZ
VHEHLSLIALFGIAAHGAALLGDRFLHPRVQDILVPGLIHYRPAAVAAGIVAAYLAALFGLSFYARRHVGAQRWRKLHRFSAVAWALSVVHTLTAGSDAGAPWLRVPLFASVGLAVALLIARAGRSRAGHRGAAASRRSVSGNPQQSAVNSG